MDPSISRGFLGRETEDILIRWKTASLIERNELRSDHTTGEAVLELISRASKGINRGESRGEFWYKLQNASRTGNPRMVMF